MPRQTTVRGVLLAAARLIERRGWCQHALAKGPRRCVWGAIRQIATGYPNKNLNELAYRSRVVLCMAIQHDSATVWNDAPQRTKAEVLRALRAAAKGAPR